MQRFRYLLTYRVKPECDPLPPGCIGNFRQASPQGILRLYFKIGSAATHAMAAGGWSVRISRAGVAVVNTDWVLVVAS